MLSLLSTADVAVPAATASAATANAATVPMRVRPRAGASLSGGLADPRALTAEHLASEFPAGWSAMTGPMAASCPRVSARKLLFGIGTLAAGRAFYARQQRITNKFAHTYTTRIAPVGGGALGSHPPRDPV